MDEIFLCKCGKEADGGGFIGKDYVEMMCKEHNPHYGGAGDQPVVLVQRRTNCFLEFGPATIAWLKARTKDYNQSVKESEHMNKDSYYSSELIPEQMYMVYFYFMGDDKDYLVIDLLGSSIEQLYKDIANKISCIRHGPTIILLNNVKYISWSQKI